MKPTARPTPISEFAAGHVVRVPFPYSDFSTVQRRPALVIAPPLRGDGPSLMWVLMITSAGNRGWDGDVLVKASAATGLPVASIVRTAKIATIEAARADHVGQVDVQTLAAIRATIARRLAG